MIKKVFFFGCLILMLANFFTFSFSAFLEASAPEIYSITPNVGIGAVSNQVTIGGAGFAPTPKVSLYGGGPYITGSCDTPGRVVFVAGLYAYVTDPNSGLQIINITDPNNPSLTGVCDLTGVYGTPYYVSDVCVSGSYAYVAGDHVLRIINITDPSNPFIAASHIFPSFNATSIARSVYVKGTYAYVTVYTYGFMFGHYSRLWIINITDPHNPSVTGVCGIPSVYDIWGVATNAWDVHVKGTYAYLATDCGRAFDKIMG